MRLTRKVCYGIRALHYAGCRPAGKFCSVEEIGQAQEIPRQFLAKVVQDLVRTGFLASRRGQDGGVRLVRPLCEITVLDILEALEGPMALSECLRPHPGCSWAETCPMKQVWKEVQTMIQSHLESVNLEVAELVHEDSK